MAKSKKNSRREPSRKASPGPAPTLPPQFLEKAAQGWLNSSGTRSPDSSPNLPSTGDRLTAALREALLEHRREIEEIRTRLERLETRGT